MTHAHRTHAVVSPDGRLSIGGIPFKAGQSVEVIVLLQDDQLEEDVPSLEGTVLVYEDPTGSAVDDCDWDALR